MVTSKYKGFPKSNIKVTITKLIFTISDSANQFARGKPPGFPVEFIIHKYLK